jgi:hypothetical protein
MKKTFLVFVAIALISLPFVISSCEEDNPVSCTKLLEDITKTSVAYSNDMSSSSKCNDYKDALKDYIDSDCTLASMYESTYNSLSCN